MAISSSPLPPDPFEATPVGKLTKTAPHLEFGPDPDPPADPIELCGTLTVTIQQSVSVQLDPNNPGSTMVRDMKKKYTVRNSNPFVITIEVLEKVTGGPSPHDWDTVFKINVDPSVRDGRMIQSDNTHAGFTRPYYPNPKVYYPASDTTQPEKYNYTPPGSTTATGFVYEAYNLPILNFRNGSSRNYDSRVSPPVFPDIKSDIYVGEWYEDTSRGIKGWSILTVGSLLTDLLSLANTTVGLPYNFIDLIIVGNDNIADQYFVPDIDYRFTGPTPFMTQGNPRIPPPTQVPVATPYQKFPYSTLSIVSGGVTTVPYSHGSAEDKEYNWNLFLISRAENLKKLAFGSASNLNIKCVPAIDILAPDPPGHVGTDPVYNNILTTRYQTGSGATATPDINFLKSHDGRLQMHHFNMGSVFLWTHFSVGHMIPTNIYFETNKFDLSYPSDPVKAEANQNALDKLVNFIRDMLIPPIPPTFTTNLTGFKIAIEAHTDTVGSTASNETLSQNRAEAVHNYLIAHLTLAEQAVLDSPVWYGETRPLKPTADEVEEQENRVVVFRVTDFDCPTSP